MLVENGMDGLVALTPGDIQTALERIHAGIHFGKSTARRSGGHPRLPPPRRRCPSTEARLSHVARDCHAGRTAAVAVLSLGSFGALPTLDEPAHQHHGRYGKRGESADDDSHHGSSAEAAIV